MQSLQDFVDEGEDAPRRLRVRLTELPSVEERAELSVTALGGTLSLRDGTLLALAWLRADGSARLALYRADMTVSDHTWRAGYVCWALDAHVVEAWME